MAVLYTEIKNFCPYRIKLCLRTENY